jgi:hypothetical protein
MVVVWREIFWHWYLVWTLKEGRLKITMKGERSLKENYICVNVTCTKIAFFCNGQVYRHSWMKKSYIIINLWPSSIFRQNIKTISLLLIFFSHVVILCVTLVNSCPYTKWLESHSSDTTLCDKIKQCHDIAEILLKVALNTINQTKCTKCKHVLLHFLTFLL